MPIDRWHDEMGPGNMHALHAWDTADLEALTVTAADVGRVARVAAPGEGGGGSPPVNYWILRSVTDGPQWIRIDNSDAEVIDAIEQMYTELHGMLTELAPARLLLAPVAAVADTNIPLHTPPPLIDDRQTEPFQWVLLHGQTDPSENGLWRLEPTAQTEPDQPETWTWVQHRDGNPLPLSSGALVICAHGTKYSRTLWVFRNERLEPWEMHPEWPGTWELLRTLPAPGGGASSATQVTNDSAINPEAYPHVAAVLEYLDQRRFMTSEIVNDAVLASDHPYLSHLLGYFAELIDSKKSYEGAVHSVFARAGNVVATLGDYAASLITNDSDIDPSTYPTVAAALTRLNALIGQLGGGPTGITSVFGRVTASISAEWNDYAASQVRNDSAIDNFSYPAVSNALTFLWGRLKASTIANDSGTFAAGTFPTVADVLTNIQNQLNGKASSGAVGAVASVFGRTGAIVATLNDYKASFIQNDSAVTGQATTADALTYLLGRFKSSTVANDAGIASLPAGTYPTVATVFTQLVNLLAAKADKATQAIAGAGLTGGGTLGASFTFTAAVQSVFGRTGQIVAVAGDYNSDQILDNSNVEAQYVTQAHNAFLARIETLEGATAPVPAPATATTNGSLTAEGFRRLTYDLGPPPEGGLDIVYRPNWTSTVPPDFTGFSPTQYIGAGGSLTVVGVNNNNASNHIAETPRYQLGTPASSGGAGIVGAGALIWRNGLESGSNLRCGWRFRFAASAYASGRSWIGLINDTYFGGGAHVGPTEVHNSGVMLWYQNGLAPYLRSYPPYVVGGPASHDVVGPAGITGAAIEAGVDVLFDLFPVGDAVQFKFSWRPAGVRNRAWSSINAFTEAQLPARTILLRPFAHLSNYGAAAARYMEIGPMFVRKEVAR